MALTGTETFYVTGQDAQGRPSGENFQTTTLAVAALADAANNPPVINTAISTVGNGTLTAAGIVGGVITRTGPTSAYSDAVDTAANIIAALDAYILNESFFLEVRNTTAFTQTITTATGVTLTGNVVVPAFSIGRYLVTITAPTTVTIFNIDIVPLSTSLPKNTTTLSTVGAGTITAAGIAGQATLRTGSQSATPFTDTTDTAANIITAVPNAAIGMTFDYIYKNNTDAAATITGGTGVTVSGFTVVPPNGSARFLVKYTAAATITMVGLQNGAFSADAADPTKLIAFKSSGATTATTATIASTTAANATYTLPPSTGVLAGTTGTNLYVADLKRTSASVTKNANVTYANVTGLSFTVVPGTYAFYAYLPSTVASGTGGIKYAFNYTTTVVSVLQATGVGSTASAQAVQQTTTTTTQTDIFTQAAVVLLTELIGTMVVTTGGTVDIQMAQNTSNGSDTVAVVGGYAEFVRIS